MSTVGTNSQYYCVEDVGAKLFVHSGLCLRAKRSSLQEVGAVLNQVNIFCLVLFGSSKAKPEIP